MRPDLHLLAVVLIDLLIGLFVLGVEAIVVREHIRWGRKGDLVVVMVLLELVGEGNVDLATLEILR